MSTPEPISENEMLARRLAVLEKRNGTLEKRIQATDEAFLEMTTALKGLELSITRNIMRAFSGVFHNLSDQLLALSMPPASEAGHFEITKLEDNTPDSIIVKRTGDHYDFSTTKTPDQIQNEGTEPLAEIIRKGGMLDDGATGWFSIVAYEAKPDEPATKPAA